MKPKSNRKTGDGALDRCQTPPYALTPLLSFLPKGATIWESAAGDGFLAHALVEAGYTTIGTDILMGTNFYQECPAVWDIQVTNPPYSQKPRWLERSYGLGKPFALLLPVEFIGTFKAQTLFVKYGHPEFILLDHRVNFKMPAKGWSGEAQFPVCWVTWGLNIGCAVTYGQLSRTAIKRQKEL